MTDRLEIKLTGPLPEEEKYAILAAAQVAATAMAKQLNEDHKIVLAVSVAPVRPSAGRGKVAAAAPAPEPPSGEAHTHRHAAE